jgi:hypothetical protein
MTFHFCVFSSPGNAVIESQCHHFWYSKELKCGGKKETSYAAGVGIFIYIV